MANRSTSFSIGEYYHIYNRGVDKRDVFLDNEDTDRFIQSVQEFNSLEPIGSIYEHSFDKEILGSPSSKSLVSVVAYCLNPNHFHFVLRQESEKGVEKFMQRLGTGYSKYFNNKNKRTGALFQGKFKDSHIQDNEYLLRLSVYVNLNDKVHQLGSPSSKLMVRNSWREFIDKESTGFCCKDIILGQFSIPHDYEKFALDLLPILIENKIESRELESETR